VAAASSSSSRTPRSNRVRGLPRALRVAGLCSLLRLVKLTVAGCVRALVRDAPNAASAVDFRFRASGRSDFLILRAGVLIIRLPLDLRQDEVDATFFSHAPRLDAVVQLASRYIWLPFTLS